MNQSNHSPKYKNEPIRSVEALSRALRIDTATLLHISSKANELYRLARPIIKPDGSVRQPFDAHPPLKMIQKRIQWAIFGSTEFPAYLTGSLPRQDARRNALHHVGAAIVVCEDIKQFFPSISFQIVQSIWSGFYRFSDDVSHLLTLLTTKGGSLPQGAVTSSYLANLVFWNREPSLRSRLLDKGLAYSRYVDDITISSKTKIPKPLLTWAIAQLYGMMRAHGLSANRRKQEIQRSHNRMRVTKLVANRRPSLPIQARKAIRAAVFQLEQNFGRDGQVAPASSVAGRVAHMSQMHPRKSKALRSRIAALELPQKQREPNEVRPVGDVGDAGDTNDCPF